MDIQGALPHLSIAPTAPSLTQHETPPSWCLKVPCGHLLRTHTLDNQIQKSTGLDGQGFPEEVTFRLSMKKWTQISQRSSPSVRFKQKTQKPH